MLRNWKEKSRYHNKTSTAWQPLTRKLGSVFFYILHGQVIQGKTDSIPDHEL